MSFLDQRELGNPAPSEVSHLKAGSVGDDQRSDAEGPMIWWKMLLPSASPMVRAAVSSNQKWTPNQTRLQAFSSEAALKLSNERVTPGSSSEPIVKWTLSVP